jgi:hypothetical protein
VIVLKVRAASEILAQLLLEHFKPGEAIMVLAATRQFIKQEGAK